mgnify:CR=1 FL=1
MRLYREFQPTGFDHRGLGLRDQQDWLVVPVTRNRDSGPAEESNWETALKMLDPDDDCEDMETHSFNHWACGWFEIIIVKPGTKAAEVAEDIESALADYPLLGDEDCSEREWEAHSTSVEEELNRIAWKHDGEVSEDCDYGRLCDALGWDYHGRSPDDDDILNCLVEHGWFVPDEEECESNGGEG